ncbi:hypothetical protein ABZ816_34495 [Actinosynnema sp. NPDC047251]|uniref:Uncharacterized protein n=1 Tax=Saccharothrix espanaensis (strain ATCC 51144 / DSM 44229 / JCM 9112 / NBRC 15066 / NRRL 15764) TaxID=1179773 RepID=K0K5P5_SACES|nr:hypothetical protein [Saccharothrix espanaensis]CCH32189.1 hypothetical protein BN6_49190 [Saccharothrix espanaensis DSM 44229]
MRPCARTDSYPQVEPAPDYRSVNVYLTGVRQGKKSRQQLRREISEITDSASPAVAQRRAAANSTGIRIGRRPRRGP